MNGFALDGDSAFTFQLHAVQDLIHHFALLKNAGCFQNPVCQRAFSVIDMRDDTEIADFPHIIRHG